MAESSLNWDDLSDTPPALPPAPTDSADPDADAIIAKMNAGVAAGKSEDDILSTEVADFGRKGRAASATASKAPKSLNWDDLSFTQPQPQDDDLKAQQLVYNAPNYSPVPNSPVPPPEPEDPGYEATVEGNLRSAGLSTVRGLALAASTAEKYNPLLIPINYAREKLTGLSSDDVNFAIAEKARQFEEEHAPAPPVTRGEKAAGIAANVLGGFGTLGMGGPEAAAQDIIAQGGSVSDAEKALAIGAAQQEVGAAVGMAGRSLPGRIALQVPANVATGMGARALQGQDATDPYAVASDVGSALGSAALPNGREGPPAEVAASRARSLADQSAINEGVDIAKKAGDSSGMSDAIAEAKVAVDAAPTQETTNATETGQVTKNDQPEHQGNAESGIPAEASGSSSNADGAAEKTPVAHAAARLNELNTAGRALTDSERAEKTFLESNPDAATIANAYNLKETPNVDTNAGRSAAGGAAEQAQETPARRPSEVRSARLQELRETGEAQGLTADQVREYGALVNADRTQGRIAHTGEAIEGLTNEAGRQEKLASGEIPANRAFIDLVGFHDWNEKYGYGNGNAVLRTFGRELAAQLPPEHGSVVGGDEFYAHGTPEQLAAAEQGLREKMAGKAIEIRDKDGNVIDRIPAPDFRMGQGEDDATAQAAAKQSKPSSRSQAEGNAEPSVGAAEGAGEGAALDRTGTDFSRGEQAQGVNAFVARKALEKSFGASALRKMEAAGLKLTPSSELPKLAPELPENQRGGVKGVTTGKGQPHIIHDQTPAGELAGVAVHEIWHANHDRVLSPGQEAGLARRVDALAERNPKVRAAVDKIPVGERTVGEKVAYALQHLQDQSLGRRALDSIKLGLNRLGVPLDWMNAHEAALREIGQLNLRHFQEAGGTSHAEGPGNQYHRVYHGSPHDFDKFDSSKMGTGEGNQAYGHGLYFAGKKEIADHYKRQVSTDHLDRSPEVAAAKASLKAELKKDDNLGFETAGEAIGALRSHADWQDRWEATNPERINKLLSEYESARAKFSGHGYEVELAPQEHEYLDWDKPLSEQTEHARAALAGVDDGFTKAAARVASGERARDVAMDTGTNPLDLMVGSGGALYKHLASKYGSDRASQMMHDAGIRGIRYLDASSRSAGEGSHNYVIFNDKDVQIVNKYSRSEVREPAEHTPGTFNPEKVRGYMAGIGKPLPTPAPQPSERTQGIKNAYKAQERTERGLQPLDAEGKRDFGAVWDAATAKRQNDLGAGARLAADVAADPRPLRPEETALLVQHGAELNNRYDKALSDIEAARQSGDTAAETDAQLHRRELDDLLAVHDTAARQSGYEQGLGLAMRRAMAKQDYSLARQLARFKAIEVDGNVPEMVRKRLEGYIKQEATARKALDDHLAGQQQPRGASKPRKTLDDDFSKMAARLKAIAGGRTEQQFARVADPETATLIRKMARNRSDAGETDPDRILDAIHEAIGRTVPRQDIADTITTNAPARKHTKTELQARYDALKKSLRDPEVQRNATRQKAITQELADIKSRIQRGDFSKEKRAAPVYDEKTMKLQGELNQARDHINNLAQMRQRAQQSTYAKFLDWFHNMHMMDILSSVYVYPKLAAAVAGTHAERLTSGATVTAVRHGAQLADKVGLSGLLKITQLAERYGHGLRSGELSAVARGLKNAAPHMENGELVRGSALEQITKGMSKLEMMHGDPTKMSSEYTGYMGNLHDAMAMPNRLDRFFEGSRVVTGIPGRTHAAVKEFISNPEYERSYLQRSGSMREKLARDGKRAADIDEFMNRGSTKALLGAKAMADAYESKMQGKNAIADWVNRSINSLDRNGDVGSKTLAFVLKSFFPIRRIGMNIAKEATSLTFGGIKAAYAARHGVEGTYNGVKGMTPERADYIMKNVGKQGTGLMLMAIGATMPELFGGFPGFEKKDKNAKVKPDEAEIHGIPVGAAAFHGAPAMMLQLGAGLRRVFEKDYGNHHDATDAVLHAFADQYGSMMERTVPYSDQARRISNTIEYGRSKGFMDRGHGYGAVVGNQVRSMIEPQILQQAAQYFDPYQGYYAPRNIGEDLKLGIPGHGIPGVIGGREDVPHEHKH